MGGQAPSRSGEPGDGGPDLAPWLHLIAAIEALKDLLHDTPHAPAVAAHAATGIGELLHRVASRVEQAAASVAAQVESGVLDLALHLARAIGENPAAHAEGDHPLLRSLLDHARAAIDRVLAGLERGSDDIRRLRVLLNLGLTLLRGALADRVISRGFDALDDVEFRTWLRGHGAAEATVGSAAVSSLYDAGFSYLDGRHDRPDMAAGVALQSLLRIFLSQRGPFSWRMKSGMGDVVFSPLYQVLAARGVRFRFFHRVTRLVYDEATNTVAGIEMDEQVKLAAPYEPLIRVKGVDAWPSMPRSEFIENGAELEAAIVRDEIDLESRWSPAWRDQRAVTLRHGVDYDLVVLGISLGALGEICADVARAKPAWQSMLRDVKTVETQAQQLWFRPSMAELGWSLPPSVVQGYPPSLGQWLDASHAIALETWNAGDEPGALLYFCDVWPDGPPAPPSDHTYPARELAGVTAAARAWLDNYPGTTWPGATRPGSAGLDWNQLYDPLNGRDDERLARQYIRINVEPSERFVLSTTGSTASRLTADGSGVDGLFLTGDWIRNGFNVGCVESTVISGLQCARAIDGRRRDIADEHFFRA